MEGINKTNEQFNNSEEDNIKKLQEKILQSETFIKQLCYRILYKENRTEMAEELTNIALYKAYRNADKLKKEKGEDINGWLTTITKNVITDYFRRIQSDPIGIKSKKAANIDDLYYLEDKNLNPEELLLKKEKSAILLKTFEGLPEKYQMPLMLRSEGMSYEEIAKKLNMNLNTVKSSISRGREELRKRLEN